ncbi:MAG TPA: 16S rRNA (guanine(966)-N(2))-methyltransferase RsmD [Acidimicrobiia bacterium]|nr:16S rRNA (guanine(966)-N(2))-methyltransferase RsmD [Acidimicrobiia bacterium]
MRIVAGRAKGITLSHDVADKTRPTSDRVRESIFNMLEARIDFDGCTVADLYAGTGALGLEALSRGANAVTFVERDKKACEIITKNIDRVVNHIQQDEKTKMTTSCVQGDVKRFVSTRAQEQSCDLVFCDPPYDNDIDASVINILVPQGLLVYETDKRKLAEAEKDLSTHDRCDEILISREMGSAGVIILRVK